MKRYLVAAAIAATTLLTPHADAMADKPTSVVEQLAFVDVNPCTGETVDILLTFDLLVHEHPANTVLTVTTSVAQSDGWSGGGKDTVVISERGLIESVNLRTYSPDRDRFFVVKHVWKYGPDGEPLLIRDTIECRR